MISYFPPHDFREHYSTKPTQFPTRDSPVVLYISQIKTRTHPQLEARHAPCCICPHSFPRSKGRSIPRTAFPLLALHRHRFPGSKVRSSAPTQVAFHQESWPLVLLLLLLLLLPLLLYFACSSLLERTSSGNTVPGSKGWADAPLSPQISPADPAADASFLAALAADATWAAVPPADGVASASASDDTAPVDDSRPPTAPLIDAAKVTVPLVAGSAANISPDAAVTVDDAGAPPTDVAREQYRRSPGSSSIPLFHLQKRGPWPPPPPMQWGKQYRRSLALLQVPPPMPRPLTMRALPPHPSTTQRGRHGCRSPLQPQVLLQQVPLPSAPTAAVPPTERTSASSYHPTEVTVQRPSPR